MLLGIDIGGTKCAVVLGRSEAVDSEERLTVVDKAVFPTQAERGPGHTIESIRMTARRLMADNRVSSDDLEAIGISCGGPLDSARGVVMSPPNLYGWDNVPLVAILQDAFGVRARLQNDANACALAEWRFGAARGYRNVIFLTFGTGMGAGLIIDGRLYAGTNDMAGEVGHVRMCEHGPVGYGKEGSFEGFCSGGGIAQLGKTRALELIQRGERTSFCASIDEIDRIDAKRIAAAATDGDETAKGILATAGRYLGAGLSTLIDILNPEIIVLGGIYPRCREYLWNSAHAVLRSECLERSLTACRIVPAALGEQIGDYAALTMGLT